MTPAGEDAAAQRLLTLLADGRVDQSLPLLGPDLQKGEVKSGLEQLHQTLDRGGAAGIRNAEEIGLQRQINANSPLTSLRYQIQFQDGWALATVTFGGAEAPRIVGIQVQPISESLEVTNRFTFKGKKPTHYVWAAISAGILALVIGTVVTIVRSPIRHRWLWLLIALIGIFKLNLNWTTDEAFIVPVNINFLGVVGIVKWGLYDPWIAYLTLPVGSILFWIIRRQLMGRGRSS